jgi:DNA invertase Pin-like site-specific DNA recombinase
MTRTRQDIVAWLKEWLLANEDSITEELALRMEAAVRREWGGQEVRVWKTPEGRAGRPPRVPYDAARAYSDGISIQPTEEVTERHGISRATLYRLVKRGPGNGGG